MKKIKSIKLQLLLASCMLLVSIFMTISYYIKIANNDVGKLSKIAFYVWIFSIFAWLVKVIHDGKLV